MGFVGWEAAARCTGGPQPGAVALMNWILEHYGRHGAYNLGIYNCRPVRGGGTWSLHSEGRALDIGLPVGSDGTGTVRGHRLVERLRELGEPLGVQCMIYDRRIWSAKSPGPEGRSYTGVSPHYNHIHLELCWKSARNLDADRVARVLGGNPVPGPRDVSFAPYNRTAAPGHRRLRLGSAGDDVKAVQEHIGPQRCGDPDGYFGHKTKSGVRWFQDLRGIKPDGVVGKATWAQLLGTAPAPRPQPRPRPARVDLSRLQAAAQRGDDRYPHGTRIVQRALRLENGLEQGDPRGVFDGDTKAHYRDWQRSLGFTGTDADGIPGEESLRRLGKKYDFRVAD
jgi:peptidoglycan hydrolase-like protein with peptidoglycan-binding domain